MRIVHRVGHRLSESQRALLDSLGVRFTIIATAGGGNPLVAFDLVEGERPDIHALAHQWKMSETAIWTEFTDQEIQDARWCSLVTTWQHGYPQPDPLNFGHRKATYDLSGYCVTCGVGMKQRASFQMKGEPKWGRRAILQLHWVGDEYFVTPEVWSHIFQPRGVACMAVTDTQGTELTTVVQLVVDGDQVNVSTAGLIPHTCATCGRTKYEHPVRGSFPALLTEPGRPIIKTVEWFGSGAAADKRVIVSQEVVHAMTAFKLRGTTFCPVSRDESGASGALRT